MMNTINFFLGFCALPYKLAYKGFKTLIFLEARAIIPSQEQSSRCVISELSAVFSGVLAASQNIL